RGRPTTDSGTTGTTGSRTRCVVGPVVALHDGAGFVLATGQRPGVRSVRTRGSARAGTGAPAQGGPESRRSRERGRGHACHDYRDLAAPHGGSAARNPRAR